MTSMALLRLLANLQRLLRSREWLKPEVCRHGTAAGVLPRHSQWLHLLGAQGRWGFDGINLAALCGAVPRDAVVRNAMFSCGARETKKEPPVRGDQDRTGRPAACGRSCLVVPLTVGCSK